MELPLLFEKRMSQLLGQRCELFKEHFLAPLNTRGLRANTLKCSAMRLQEIVGLPLASTPFSSEGFVTTAEFRAGSDPLHHAGAYYMQEPSAMSAVTLLAPQRGERVLDLCAAPGGKSTQIAAALGHTGLLWANEYVPARARILAQNLERCGVRRAVVSCGDTARIAEELPFYFDAVLADVPCSGEGMFRKEPEALANWTEENIRLCATRSTEILNNAARCVRPGGRLVLSTCTFAPEENEWAVVRFLRDNPDFELEEAALPFGDPAFDADTIAPFGEEDLLPFARTVPLERCRRVFPWHGGEGHFLALLRRAGDTVVSQPCVTEVADRTGAVAAAKELYAACFSDEPDGVFMRVGDTVRFLPRDLPNVSGVHIVCAGVTAANVMSGRSLRLEPAHAIYQSSQLELCRQAVNLSSDDPQLTAFLRGEELRVDLPDGWTAVAVENIVTGFGKIAGGRLKNRYPKGLRLLQR